MNLLRRALDRFRSGDIRWIKGGMGDGHNGRCLLGGVFGINWDLVQDMRFPEEDEHMWPLYEVLREQYPNKVRKADDRLAVPGCIAQFNDRWLMTQDEVERILEKAAVRLEERVE